MQSLIPALMRPQGTITMFMQLFSSIQTLQQVPMRVLRPVPESQCWPNVRSIRLFGQSFPRMSAQMNVQMNAAEEMNRWAKLAQNRIIIDDRTDPSSLIDRSIFNSKGEKTQWTSALNRERIPSSKCLRAAKNAPFFDRAALAQLTTPPRDALMLVRDFIGDSLYNKHYGYFNKHVEIFESSKPFQFTSLKSSLNFHSEIARAYHELEDSLEKKRHDDARQLWHTPTELFKPYFGQAIANYLINEYKLTNFPYKDLVIYEIGAANGTLMVDILNHIYANEPEIYERTRYRTCEVSPTLAEKQHTRIRDAKDSLVDHSPRVEVFNKDILEWTSLETDPCFIIAMEVFDNFAHDLLRFDAVAQHPLQGLVYVDRSGEIYELLTTELDTYSQMYLDLRRRLGRKQIPNSLFSTPAWLRRQIAPRKVPFTSAYSLPMFVPATLLQFFDVLREFFPQHRLIASDFAFLPDTIDGNLAPVVQTRFKRTMIACKTYLVAHGYFDFIFPTDWELIRDLYDKLDYFHSSNTFASYDRSLGRTPSKLLSHKEFLSIYANVDATRTKSGDSPMLDWFENVSFFFS